ncbi:enoyl-CoA hydratase/isomerase family protein [Pseudomonas juntendi]|nr:enoyl-CoA hydratase/isomerase family protein [Pseudomonas juntendi]
MQQQSIQQFLETQFDGFQVEVDVSRERADIILNRAPLNVISMGQRDELRLVFEALDAHQGVRVIVLRSVGEHFSSGGDIKGFLEASPEHVSKLAWNVAAPARCEKPVIVANRGYTFGVGFELSLACDFRIASQTTRYALPEQNLGQIPGSGGSARLQKIIGITRTKHMVMRAKRITGDQAYAWVSLPRSCRIPNWKAPSMRWSMNCAASRRWLSARRKN